MRKFLILFIFTPFFIMGQIFKSANQQFVEQAVKNGIFIIKQTYQLEDTTTQQRFGRYGNDDFGAFTSLAIRTSDGYLVDSCLLYPWTTDSNYSRYRSSHKPVLASSYSMDFGDSIMSPISFVPDSLNYHRYRLTKLNPQDSSYLGFENRIYKKPTEGWAVWLSSDSILNEFKGHKKPELTIYKRTIDFHPDSLFCKIDAPNTSNRLWGGIFVVPQQTAIGQLTFFLGGVFVKDFESEEWIVVSPICQTTANGLRPADELTPLKPAANDNKKIRKK